MLYSGSRDVGNGWLNWSIFETGEDLDKKYVQGFGASCNWCNNSDQNVKLQRFNMIGIYVFNWLFYAVPISVWHCSQCGLFCIMGLELLMHSTAFEYFDFEPCCAVVAVVRCWSLY